MSGSTQTAFKYHSSRIESEMEIIRINHRWKNILALMSELTWVSIEDILPIIPNKKYARRVMRELISKGLMKHTQCSLPFQSRGPGMNFYALKKTAERFFDTPIKEPKIPTSTHLFHFYITNTFITGFKVLSNIHNGFTVNCAAEKELRSICQEFNRTDFSSDKTAIPDFAICISVGTNHRLFLGEVDAETETISSTIANKIDSIKRTCYRGLLDKLSDKFSFPIKSFAYLHITSGDESRARKVIIEAKNSSPKFPVYVSCFDSFYPYYNSYEKLIERVWYSLDDRTVSILEEI